MRHIIFFYYFFAFYFAMLGIGISITFFIKIKDVLVKNYLIFFGFFGIKILQIIVISYIFSSMNTNKLILDTAYAFAAIITMMFFCCMIWVINENFNIKLKKILNILWFFITFVLMFVGLYSYKIDIINQKIIIYKSFYVINIYLVISISYVLYISARFIKNYKKKENYKTNKFIRNIFMISFPGVIYDSFKFIGNTEINIGEKFLKIYFLPFIYCTIVILFAIHLKKTYDDKKQEQNIEEIYENEKVNEEIIINEKNNTANNLGNFYTENKISEREKEVIELIINGYSNQDISEKLFISISTVKTHLSNIYKKTGTKKRSELIEIVKNS